MLQISELKKDKNMNNHIYIVYEFIDMLDSVWTTRDLAEIRASGLDRENEGDYSHICEYITDCAEGYVPF